MQDAKRIFIAGHRGMVGAALYRQLERDGQHAIVTRDRDDLDLTDQRAVEEFFQSEQLDTVYLAAAKVGGIQANVNYPAEFIYQNLIVQANVIHAAYRSGVEQLLFLGSSCIYPRAAAQPITESALLTGMLEPTNEPYAVAKIAGIKLCESYNRQYGCDFRSVMPTNLYGPNDNFHPDNCHVVPALIRRFHEATRRGDREVMIWGTGTPRREFLHVDDMASACIHVMGYDRAQWQMQTQPMVSHVNVGTGQDCSIRELAETLIEVTGFRGKLVFDDTKPDGTPRKWLDVSQLSKLGWKATISLEDGLRSAYRWYLEHVDRVRQ